MKQKRERERSIERTLLSQGAIFKERKRDKRQQQQPTKPMERERERERERESFAAALHTEPTPKLIKAITKPGHPSIHPFVVRTRAKSGHSIHPSIHSFHSFIVNERCIALSLSRSSLFVDHGHHHSRVFILSEKGKSKN